jgi:hypothetical protein
MLQAVTQEVKAATLRAEQAEAGLAELQASYGAVRAQLANSLEENMALSEQVSIISHRVMSCHVMSCHVMSCHVMSCHVTSRHVTSRHVMS